MKVWLLSGSFLLASLLPAQIELCTVQGTNAGDQLGIAVAAVTSTSGAKYALFGALAGGFQLVDTGTVTVRSAQCAAPPPFFFPITGSATGDPIR